MARTLFFTAVFAALYIVVLSVDVGQFTVDTPKCKFSAKTKALMAECYKEVTKKDFDAATFKMDALTPEDKLAIGKCIAIKEGYLSADGKTVDMPKTLASVDTLEADPAVKEALKTGFEACITKGGDGVTILTCNKGVFQTNCK